MKSIADVLAAAVPALADIKTQLLEYRAALVKAGDNLPDLKPAFDRTIAELDRRIVALDTAVSPEALVGLGMKVIEELAALPKVGLSGTAKPGDVTGS